MLVRDFLHPQHGGCTQSLLRLSGRRKLSWSNVDTCLQGFGGLLGLGFRVMSGLSWNQGNKRENSMMGCIGFFN